jgi:ribonuclease D
MQPQTDAETSRSSPPVFTWISSPDTFREMAEVLARAGRLAVDIEADSLYHYFEKVCLIQISSDTRTYVIDPLALRSLSELGGLMADPAIEKVFHAAAYDLLSLKRDYGFAFRNMFDTHVAAQLLGHEQLGLGSLLERLLGVRHSKHRQRDDWSRRPLDPDQLRYAAMDTHYLLPLRDLLERALREKGRLAWAREEFESQLDSEPHERSFDPEGFRRIKGSRELSPQQLAVLRALYLLRDHYARAMDLPPFKVLGNTALIDLARNPPSHADQLSHRSGISARVATRFGAEIFRAIRKARVEDTTESPAHGHAIWRPHSQDAQARLEKLKAWRQAKAKELNLHVGVVFPGSLLEALASSPPPDAASLARMDGMRAWRAREFGSEILKTIGS